MNSVLLYSQLLSDPASPSMEAIIFFFQDTLSFVYSIGLFVLWILFRCICIFTYLFYYYNVYDVKEKQYNGNHHFSNILSYAKGIKHFPNIEFIWTLIPALILIIIGIPSFSLFYFVEQFREPAIVLRVEGHQWYWHYHLHEVTPGTGCDYSFDSYMVSDDLLKTGQLRLLEVNTKLTLPVDTHLQIITSSVDVLHCWSVPALGVKLDCCPGRLNETALFIKRSGIFYGQCSEICGMNHAFMPIVIKAVTMGEYVSTSLVN
jgi:cytochrome c oxidase subunit 2